MIESDTEKKKIFYLIVLVLTLITMIIGVTLAYLKLIASQKEEGTVLYTGTLEINYIDGVYIKDPILLPKKEVNYNTTENVYRNTFKVASTGTLDQTISVTLLIDKNEFPTNNLKYAIFNSKGVLMKDGYIPQTGEVNLTNDLYLGNNETATYTLIIWLNNEGYNQNTLMGNQVSGRIKIDAIQVKK